MILDTIKKQRGDTLVEVLLATVVISIVIAAAYSLTNRSTQINQTALERTYSSNIMSEQAELVRGAKTAQSSGSGGSAWETIIGNHLQVTAPDYNSCQPSNGSAPFFMDPSVPDGYGSDMVKPYNGSDDAIVDIYQVWVEAYQDQPTQDYIDFHIRSCWEGIGSVGDQSSGLVVRIWTGL